MSSSEVTPLVLLDLASELPARTNEFSDGLPLERTPQAPPPPTPDEAFANGLAEGERRGREVAAKELAPVLARFQELSKAMADVRAQRLSEAEAEIVEVAAEATRRILHGELQQDGDVVVRMARACIAQAGDETPMTLHTSPEDTELLRVHLAELGADLAEPKWPTGLFTIGKLHTVVRSIT